MAISLIEYFKSMVQRSLVLFGVKLVRVTRHTELVELIEKLQPIHPGIELIRIGPMRDGGYLVPNDLEGVVTCFSPGVDKVSGFELDCANLGMDIFMADASVDGPAVSHPMFNFEKKFLGVDDGQSVISINRWIIDSADLGDSEMILQMDIEGAEYEVLLDADPKLLSRFRIILVEFHSLNELMNEPFFKIASTVFQKLLASHKCVHLHPNNSAGCVDYNGLKIPKTMEFTFLRKDRIVHVKRYDQYPHELDHRCVANKPEVTLPKCWWSEGAVLS